MSLWKYTQVTQALTTHSILATWAVDHLWIIYLGKVNNGQWHIFLSCWRWIGDHDSQDINILISRWKITILMSLFFKLSKLVGL